MAKKILIVVDMQNDFIDGALGSEYAKDVVLPNVVNKVKKANEEGDFIIFTADTHNEYEYKKTVEKVLPEHCMIATEGWRIAEELGKIMGSSPLIQTKPCFGYLYWKDLIGPLVQEETVIEVVGLCTDICVVSNALILRSAFPKNRVIVDSACCGGTSKEAHDAALTVMKSCFIEVV